jgi:hypothetical protein
VLHKLEENKIKQIIKNLWHNVEMSDQPRKGVVSMPSEVILKELFVAHRIVEVCSDVSRVY